jgi:hypothetical protein
VKPVPAPAAPALAQEAPAADAVDVIPPQRTTRRKAAEKKRAAAKVRRPAEQEAPAVAAERSTRQRREETLMQCRANGYDARQCIERACTMTRYGLACKG